VEFAINYYFFTLFFFWIGFAIVVGVAANTRGRSGGGWFLLTILISPLLAGLLLFALPRFDRSRAKDATAAPMKKCPYCAQMIPLEALVCHLCRREVDTAENVKVLLDNENKRIHEEKNLKSKKEDENARAARRQIVVVILIIVAIIVYIAYISNKAADNSKVVSPSSTQSK
jgi:flagellar basal body-associated protein FliL